MTATANTSSISATSQLRLWQLHYLKLYIDAFFKNKTLLFCRVLLRVRMLYYLKQEVIGEHADSVLKGADIRYVLQLKANCTFKLVLTCMIVFSEI